MAERKPPFWGEVMKGKTKKERLAIKRQVGELYLSLYKTVTDVADQCGVSAGVVNEGVHRFCQESNWKSYQKLAKDGRPRLAVLRKHAADFLPNSSKQGVQQMEMEIGIDQATHGTPTLPTRYEVPAKLAKVALKMHECRGRIEDLHGVRLSGWWASWRFERLHRKHDKARRRFWRGFIALYPETEGLPMELATQDTLSVFLRAWVEASQTA